MLETTTDEIFINRVQLTSCQIGLDAWERVRVQPVWISVRLGVKYKLALAAEHDDLQPSVNYGTLCKMLVRICAHAVFEDGYTFTQHIIQHIFDTFHMVERVELKTELPKALLHGNLNFQATAERSTEMYSMVSFTSHIKEIPFDLIVGMNECERQVAQLVLVSISFSWNSGRSLSHRNLVEFVRAEAKQTQYKTVESLAYFVADACFRYEVNISQHIRVCVTKPSALTASEGAGVCVTRDQSDFSRLARHPPNSGSNIVYIGIGSNVGNRYQYIELALKHLEESGIVNIEDTSFMYESKAQYVEDQTPFLNAVVKVATTVELVELLHHLKAVEHAVGRIPRQRFGPREIDLDILICENGQTVDQEADPQLTVPHPRLHEREFVLRPLCE